ncbi:hypothetical protein [Novosphingobium sp. PY1]|nr:hypothetical protein [Novosphingobium sp. PY1]
MNSCSERAFLEAREILRKDGALTREECDRLVDLFDQVSRTQLSALTREPGHQESLRNFDKQLRKEARPILVIMGALFLISVVLGIYAAWHL